MRNTVLAAALGIAILGLGHTPIPKAQEPGRKEPARASGGELWKSETSGKVFRVRVENGVFHSDCVSLAPALTRKGAHIRARCPRVGSKWRGTSEIYLPCAAGESRTAAVSNWCRMTMGMEVLSMTSDRITGQMETPRVFDCVHCKVAEAVWRPFVWVRKR